MDKSNIFNRSRKIFAVFHGQASHIFKKKLRKVEWSIWTALAPSSPLPTTYQIFFGDSLGLVLINSVGHVACPDTPRVT